MISDTLFIQFKDLFYSLSGIALKDYKKYLVEYRLQKFIGEGKQFAGYKDLYDALVSGYDSELRREFVDALTTNYTYFFREPEHFAFLAYYLKQYAPRQEYLRFWSAACSTGEEPYSIAIMVKKHLPSAFSNVKILATDISDKVLSIAQRREYSLEKIQKTMSHDTVKKYFKRAKNEALAKVSQEISDMVVFKKLNLMDPYPFTKQFDIVFLRNVLIYFENSEKEYIINKIASTLKPGGYLVVGLAESLVGVRHNLKQLKYSIYRKEP